VGSLIKVALGLLLVGLAVREFRKRPRPGQQPRLPGWMQAIDSTTAPKALGIAFLLSANPKNLSLTVAAAVSVAQQGLSTSSAAFVLALFVVLASLSIAVPVALLYVFGGASAARALDGLRAWLDANNATVMAVLLVVIGVVLLGKGLSGL
jgi:hypothetical protein